MELSNTYCDKQRKWILKFLQDQQCHILTASISSLYNDVPCPLSGHYPKKKIKHTLCL